MTRVKSAAEDRYWNGRTAVSLPPNVVVGDGSRIVADEVTMRGVFGRCRSRVSPAIVIGANSILDGVAFNLEENATVRIGSGCVLIECYLIAAQEVEIGDRVRAGWHATIVDSDFHPVPPEERREDVMALSPLGRGRPRVPGVSKPVFIGNDVWIGPLAVILKGVRIGEGARIEPGAVVTHDVAPGACVLGNPAHPVADP
jgi:acetyltransferase-like isoleucine patch superfamily enzyme